jgi:hypothetical protein
MGSLPHWLIILSLLWTLQAFVPFSERNSVGSSGTYWHVSDIHFDPQYFPGSNANDRCIEGSGKAGPWGDYQCDLPLKTLNRSMQSLVEIESGADFVIFTGDSVPHYLDYTSFEHYSQDNVTSNVRIVADAIDAAFPNTIVLPTLGNHDVYPSDQLKKPNDGGLDQLQILAEIYGRWLPADALETFKAGGYYSVLLRENLRFVAFNTLYCDVLNVNAVVFMDEDIAGQWAWLNATLAAAAANKEVVILAGHRSIGPSDNTIAQHTVPTCDDRYLQLVYEYGGPNGPLQGQIYGHEHTDSFRVFTNPHEGHQPWSMMFLAPSITTFQNVNPSFRLTSYDTTAAGLITDYAAYSINLTRANDEDEKEPVFALTYRATQRYSLPNLSAPAYWNLLQQAKSDWKVFRLMWEAFYTFRYPATDADMVCHRDCQANFWCAQAFPYFIDFDECFRAFTPIDH